MNNFSSRGYGFARRESGAVTLLVTLIIVLLMALLTYQMTTSTNIEARTTASDLRSKQAFHAAQAGLDFALDRFKANDIASLNTTDADGRCLVRTVGATNASFELLFGEEGAICPYPPLGLQSGVVVRSIGRSSDLTATRVLEARAEIRPRWTLAPPTERDPDLLAPSPIIGKETVHFAGTPEVANCDLEPGGSANEVCSDIDEKGKQKVGVDASDGIMVQAGGAITGGDTGWDGGRLVDENLAPNLAEIAALEDDEFFSKIFGETREEFIDSAGGEQKTGSPDFNTKSRVYYTPAEKGGKSELSITGGGEIGSQENPVELVVNGDFKLAGGVSIWGTVYVVGGSFSAGNSKIFGTLVLESPATITGTASVYYSPDLLAPGAPVTTGEVAATFENLDIFFAADGWREVSVLEN